MISKRDKNRIIKILGKHYTEPILEVLNEKKITNSKGEPYSANVVRKIVGGFEENEAIEEAVFDACDKANEKQQKTKARKERLKKLAS